MKIQFTANVIPHGKQRARTVMRGGYAHSYTPRETVEFEREIGKAYRIAARGLVMPENAPLMVDMVFYMPIPQSAGKRLRERLVNRYHTKRGDVDNMVKSVLDGLNSVAYKDDAQVAAIRAEKVYSEDARVEVTIRTI